MRSAHLCPFGTTVPSAGSGCSMSHPSLHPTPDLSPPLLVELLATRCVRRLLLRDAVAGAPHAGAPHAGAPGASLGSSVM